jgi:hypothetical protein
MAHFRRQGLFHVSPGQDTQMTFSAPTTPGICIDSDAKAHGTRSTKSVTESVEELSP